MNQLAVVLPAYKIEFLEQTLESIANQNSKDFTLYIGDDASNDDLYSVVRKFIHRIKLNYKRFDNNLGSNDLTAHWERCINMVNEEEWIWLFSDDDIMDINCIDSFHEILKQDNSFDLFHFNVRVIDEKNKFLFTVNFPERYLVEEFVKERLSEKIESFAVEYVFRKSIYLENDKFQKFDLAWCSDDASWIKFGRNSGIKTIKGSFVNWRRSNYNISCNSENKTILNRKYYAFIEFAKWLKDIVYLDQINLENREFDNLIKPWFQLKLKSSYLNLRYNDVYLFMHVFNRKLEKKYFNQLDILLMFFQKTCWLIKNLPKYITKFLKW